MPILSRILLSSILFLSACSSSLPNSAGSGDASYYATLSEQQADAELATVLKEIDELDEKINGAEARLNSARWSHCH
jgi:hypothetical protein